MKVFVEEGLTNSIRFSLRLSRSIHVLHFSFRVFRSPSFACHISHQLCSSVHPCVLHSSFLGSCYRCREGVREKEGEVKKVATEIEALQGTVTQLRRQISAAEERIPRLEEAKKTAVIGILYIPPPPPPRLPSPPPILSLSSTLRYWDSN